MQKLEQAKELLLKCKGKQFSLEEKIRLAIRLAQDLLARSQELQSQENLAFQKELSRMVKDPIGKVFTAEIADQMFRSRSKRRIADQIHFVLKKYGIPRFLSPFKKFQLWLFKSFGKIVPFLAVPLMQRMVQNESSRVILPGEETPLKNYLASRQKEGITINLNRLGEAILGEEEALNRLQTYLNDLANSNIHYISVKISSICSQINLIAKESTLDILAERLRMLYRAADGKFVNLDMEEYRDLQLTVELFKRVLDEPEFLHTTAGIVLQSYLPDSFLLQKEITEWAIKRAARGGSPIKIRLVKGANLAMEQVEASLRNWPQAPYATKRETDANYIQMINYGFIFDHAKTVHIGIGSHNLLDIAYALVARAENNVESYTTFEMLEGMAEMMRKAVQEVAGGILLYSPVVKKEQFQNAIAYLVRRLDENTAPDNFLSDSFDLEVDSNEWEKQVARFVQSCHDQSSISNEPKRLSNINNRKSTSFENEPDIDWSMPGNSDLASKWVKEWQNKKEIKIPIVIGGNEIVHQVEGVVVSRDPSLPSKRLYEYAIASWHELDHALTTAQQAQKNWSEVSIKERSELLRKAAEQLRKNRGNLIGAMCANTGKTVLEADPEISEAIDFAEYYRRSIEEYQFLEDILWHPKGVVLVAPPWNFSCSIPAGGIFAALAAGNSVLFKPAPEAVLVGYELAKLIWEAGISKEVLQFIPCRDEPEGSKLIQDKRLAAVILTGATATAKQFQQLRPDLELIAETGGKNAMIITAMADRDLAIKDIVQSAFGYSGQKCSACSLLILEREVFEDIQFQKALKDAASSLKVGSPYDLAVKVNPLIKPPGDALKRGLTVLDPGEDWLLEPRQDVNNPSLWSPGIKWNVKEGSFMHQTELFGPVLAVMCADNLDHAIRLANGTPYGLTSGIHSLDSREQRYWMKHITAGNCYINRGITGAIVERQPFGGCKDSSFGKGAKAGGPNYVLQFMTAEQKHKPFEEEKISDELKTLCQGNEDIEKTLRNYQYYFNRYFSRSHDPLKRLGQDNLQVYVPHDLIHLRAVSQDKVEDILKIVGACAITKTKLEISSAVPFSQFPTIVESDEEFIKRIWNRPFKRIRMLTKPTTELYQSFADSFCRLHLGQVLDNGRLELLHYLREVAYSIDYHRYGYLGLREKCDKPCSTCTKECS